MDQLQKSLQIAIIQLASAKDISQIIVTVREFLGLFPQIQHLSIWGDDYERNRGFLAYVILDRLNLSARLPTAFLFSPELRSFDIRMPFVSSHYPPEFPYQDVLQRIIGDSGLSTIALFQIKTPPGYSAKAFLLSTDNSPFSHADTLDAFEVFLASFMQNVSRVRSEAFSLLIDDIAEEKLTVSGLTFLQATCKKVAETFSADTFSLWLIEDGKLKGKYFSEPHKDGLNPYYELGEGLTGSVAKSGNPIICHVLTDAHSSYGINWLGKISDFSDSPPNEKDHMIIVPLKYPEIRGKEAKTRGVIRFISKSSRSSFWPIDLDRAQVIANNLSLLFYQELLLDELLQQMEILRSNSQVRKELLEYMFRAKAGDSIEDIGIDLLTVMIGWEGFDNADLIRKGADGKFHFSKCSFLTEKEITALDKMDITTFNARVDLSDSLSASPIIDRDKLCAVLLVSLLPDKKSISLEWVQITSLFLGSYFSIYSLIEEREFFRKTAIQRELSAIAGFVARQFAHEVINACKSINSWIGIAERQGPNYAQLRTRVSLLNENIDKLIRSSGNTIERKDCDFTQEVNDTLRLLGIKHNQNRDGCKIVLDVQGHKHRKVNLDPSTLLGIINNLVLNSTEQYALLRKTGPIEISIIEETRGDDDCVGFSVKDYAAGIQEQYFERVFEDGFTTKPQGGKGIGLTIVKNLVGVCGGHVFLESIYGSYTTFKILYPYLR